ncbi:MAG: hypothetical protein ACRERX_04690 [Pseudomonas sp.]
MTAKSSIYTAGGNTGMGAFCKSGVCADLESFFDRVNHDRLMARVRQHVDAPFERHRARVEDRPDWVESLLRHYRSVAPSARIRQVGATAITMLRMETMGQRGLPRTQKTWGQRARGLEHKQERAWPWRPSQTPALTLALPLRFFRQLGLPELATARAA